MIVGHVIASLEGLARRTASQYVTQIVLVVADKISDRRLALARQAAAAFLTNLYATAVRNTQCAQEEASKAAREQMEVQERQAEEQLWMEREDALSRAYEQEVSEQEAAEREAETRERLAAERMERELREEQERLVAEKKAADLAEKERLELEMAEFRAKLEAERLAAEKAAAEAREADRIAAEKAAAEYAQAKLEQEAWAAEMYRKFLGERNEEEEEPVRLCREHNIYQAHGVLRKLDGPQNGVRGMWDAGAVSEDWIVRPPKGDELESRGIRFDVKGRGCHVHLGFCNKVKFGEDEPGDIQACVYLGSSGGFYVFEAGGNIGQFGTFHDGDVVEIRVLPSDMPVPRKPLTAQTYFRNEWVQCRDTKKDRWQWGEASWLEPLKVRPDNASHGREFKHTRKADQALSGGVEYLVNGEVRYTSQLRPRYPLRVKVCARQNNTDGAISACHLRWILGPRRKTQKGETLS
jgi:hypothetical protein